MTNTLHRYGLAQSFRDDYILFAIPSKGRNDEGCIPKLKQFLRICLKYQPVNIGNGNRGALTPEKNMGPLAHWKRDNTPYWEAVIDGIDKPGTVSAVFSSEENAAACFKEVADTDFGISINISTSVENARRIGKSCGIKRHSVEYALPFSDPHDHLPNSQILSLSTMCGHGMVSFNMARKMMDMVREGRRTPEQAVNTLTRLCPCGVYNPERAKRLLEEARKEQR
jgi:hypothetical protein